jgi:hypothetical protein
MNVIAILAIILGVLATLAFLAHTTIYSIYTQNWNEKPSVGAMYTRIYNDVARGGAGRAATAKKALNNHYMDGMRRKFLTAVKKGPEAEEAYIQTLLAESSGKWTQYRRSRKHRQRIE